MKKGYILYKTSEDPDTGKPMFLYLQKTIGTDSFYTEKIANAKRFSLCKALFTCVIFNLAFVSEKLVKIYI